MQLSRIQELIRKDNLVKFYQCKEWYGKDGIRQQALTRDNNECQECKRNGRVTSIPMDGSLNTHTDTHTQAQDSTHLDTLPITPGDPTGEGKRKRKDSLHVHHKKEVKQFPELALVLSNVETLCKQCHNEHHDRLKVQREKKKRFSNQERW